METLSVSHLQAKAASADGYSHVGNAVEAEVPEVGAEFVFRYGHAE